MFERLRYPIELERVSKKNGTVIAKLKMITKFNVYGLAVVRKDDLLGLIDNKYELILPIEFDGISDFTSDGVCVVKRSGIHVIIGINGKKIRWIGKIEKGNTVRNAN